MRHGRLNIQTAEGLRILRRRIAAANIPSSTLDESINLATWNIREFGRRRRTNAAIHYIAEILHQFDLVAITEVRENLGDLSRVMDILGPYWKAVYSDFISDAGGNKERVAYVYDQRAVTFTGLAAEVDAPRKKDRRTGEYLPQFSWWRSPYISSFRAGTFDFVLITAHIRWGSGADARIKPLQLLADWIDKRRKRRDTREKDIIVMGDFNIPSVRSSDRLFAALTSKGLRLPRALAGDHGSNLARNKRYDQILHYPRETVSFTDHGGTLDFYASNHRVLFSNLTKREFTYQLSDHLPLWVQLNVDTEDEELDQIISAARARAR